MTTMADHVPTVSGDSLVFDQIGMVFPDGTEAVRDFSLTVKPNEFVTLVGPSGCGKTTLLRIAAGLLAPTLGRVEVDKGRIGYVFQDPTLLPWRTVRKNVELLGELDGIEPAVRAQRAADALELVGLTEYQDLYPAALSGGMKMRTSLARSLTLTPSVFLFDEPFAAVDEMTRERLNDETMQLFVSQGFAGLFITHSITEAVFMSNRVVVMSPRPGTIATDIEIPFDYPRSPELRFDPAFAEISGQVSAALREVQS